MSQPKTQSEGSPASTSATKIVITKVFVRGLEVDAHIGVYKHEKGRTQKLVMDVELDVAVTDWNALAETVNYEVIAAKARRVAAEGHRGLVETFAHHLAEACFEEPKVTRARIRVEKPSALAPEAAAAGVEITAVRG
ncbi:MAG TPA: dihydroneopterin aldolase [Caulobacteraceae bacterium]|jgi:dihydroneopterin aldolase|nr:dihydroneopterin aldolase [Caulobacteraceae bacterium]